MILSQDSTPEVRSTWVTRKAPSSAWLGTESRKEPCMAFMKEKLSPDISKARVAISEEAYWPMPPRSRAVCAARASPAIHQSGRLIPSVPARPASPKNTLATLPKPWFILAICTRWRASCTTMVLIQSLVPQKPCAGIVSKVARRGNKETEPPEYRVTFWSASKTVVCLGRVVPSDWLKGAYSVSSALAARCASASISLGKMMSKRFVRIRRHSVPGGYCAQSPAARQSTNTAARVMTNITNDVRLPALRSAAPTRGRVPVGKVGSAFSRAMLQPMWPLHRRLFQDARGEDDGGDRYHEDSPTERKRTHAFLLGDYAEGAVFVYIDRYPRDQNVGQRHRVQISRPSGLDERGGKGRSDSDETNDRKQSVRGCTLHQKHIGKVGPDEA